jgi:peptide/nickel transport system substrate-binding protein
VRQAFAYAVNRDVIAQNVFFGGSRPVATPFFREDDAVYDAEQASRYLYDLDQARQLLEEAGVADLEMTAICPAALPETGRALQIIQGDLNELGVSIQIEQLEGAVLTERWLGGDFQLACSASAVPQRDLSSVFDTVAPFRADDRNNAHWFDEAYRSLAQEAKTTLDEAARLEIYAQLRDIIVDESWVVPISTRPIAYAVRASMEGFDSSVSDFLMLEEAVIGE